MRVTQVLKVSFLLVTNYITWLDEERGGDMM